MLHIDTSAVRGRTRIMAEATKRLSVTEEQQQPHLLSMDKQPYHWYRGVLFQATVVGLCAFAAPGLWNAMQSVGAGGQQSPYLVM